MIYRFEGFELDPESYELRQRGRSGRGVPLRPRLFNVLRYLIEHRERIVTQTELLEAVWGPEHVTRSVVSWTIFHLRRALSQEPGAETPIKTIPRRGYRFCAPVSIESSHSEPASAGGFGPPFVGRQAALEVLAEGLRGACAGRGGAFLLVGEAGIGKSRCAREFAAQARSRASVWTASASRIPSMPPLWSWAQILRFCADEAPPQSKLRRACTRLAEALLTEIEDSHAGPDATNPTPFELLDRAARLIVESGSERPRLILLDDLDEADDASLELAWALTSRLDSSRVMLLATLQEPPRGRGTDEPGPARALLDNARRVPLPPWDRAEVAMYLTAVFSPEDAAAAADPIWQRSGGNPLFVQELAQLSVRQGTSPESIDGGTEPVAVPEAVRRLVRRRVAGLDAEALEVLAAASVLGRSFALALMRRVHPRPADALLACLDRALERKLIAGSERPAEFSFTHELIREAIYRDIPGVERARWHARAAQALEDPIFGPAPSSVLAWHYYCAAAIGHAGRAVHYALRAAREARRLAAHADEARYYEWALEAHALEEEPDPDARCKWLIALGAARTEAGQSDTARRHLGRAVQIAETLDRPVLMARAGLVLRASMHLARVADPLALQALEHAHRRLPEGETSLRASVASCLSCIPPHVHSPDERERLLDEALELARVSGDSRSRFDALRARCQAWVGPDRVDELLSTSAEILELAARTASRTMELEGQSYRYLGLLQLGELSEADRVLTRMMSCAGELHLREVQWIYAHVEARQKFYAGQLLHARERYCELRRAVGGVRGWMAALSHALGIAHLQLEQGATHAFWTEFQDATRAAWGISPTVRVVMLRLLLAQGRRDEAAVELDRFAAETLPTLPRDHGHLGVLAHLAVVASALHHRTLCAHLYEELAPYAARNALDGLWFHAGSVAQFLGLLAGSLGRRKVARAHLQVALRANLAMGHRVQAAWTRFALAHVVPAAERSLRVALLHACEQEAQEMELTRLIDAVGSLRTPAPRMPSGSARLRRSPEHAGAPSDGS